MSKKDTAKASDTVSVEERDATPFDPTAEHHLPQLRELAASEKKAQRKVLASGTLEEGEGERVLIVKPDGSFEIKFEGAK